MESGQIFRERCMTLGSAQWQPINFVPTQRKSKSCFPGIKMFKKLATFCCMVKQDSVKNYQDNDQYQASSTVEDGGDVLVFDFCSQDHDMDYLIQNLQKKIGVFEYPADVSLLMNQTFRLLRSRSCSSIVQPVSVNSYPVCLKSTSSLQLLVQQQGRYESSISVTLPAETLKSVHQQSASLPVTKHGAADVSHLSNVSVKEQPSSVKYCADSLHQTYDSSQFSVHPNMQKLKPWSSDSNTFANELKDAIASFKENMAENSDENNLLNTMPKSPIDGNRGNIRKKGVVQYCQTFQFYQRYPQHKKYTLQMMRASEFCYPSYEDEEKRKNTLRDLTDVKLSNYESHELARSGWFYNSRTLVTFCCGMEMPNAPVGHPLAVHSGLSPQCSFANRLRNGSQTQTVQQGEQASGGLDSESQYRAPVQCSDDYEGGSFSVEEYSYYASHGMFHSAFQESIPGDHWTIDGDNYGAPAAHSPITAEHDRLVTNATPLPSEEFRPNPQPRPDADGSGHRTVGRLSMRLGEGTSNASNVLRGLSHEPRRRTPPPVFLADQINLEGGQGEGYRARYPQFAFPTVRSWTYEGWPTERKQNPNMLADAGFFYAGYGDSVLCYSCGIGVRYWQPDDDPWIEHARWRPSCPFMQFLQGQHFIDTAREMSRNNRYPSYAEVRIAANRRQRAAEAGNEGENTAPVAGLDEDTTMLCKICYSREMSVVLMPCRHLASCPRCSGRITCCPICLGHVETTFQASFG